MWIPTPRVCKWDKTNHLDFFICTYDLNHIWLTLQHPFKEANASFLPVMCQSLASQHKRLRKKTQWGGSLGLLGGAQWLWLSPTNDSDCFCIDSVSTAPSHIIKFLSAFQAQACTGLMYKASSWETEGDETWQKPILPQTLLSADKTPMMDCLMASGASKKHK